MLNRRTMRTPLRCVLAMLVLAACGGDDDPSDPQPLPTCEVEWHPRCDHPIDRLLIPRLRVAGVPIVDAPADELCRRLYLDLVDRIPTPEERADCAAVDVVAVADRLLAGAEHDYLQRARWSELLGGDFTRTSTLDTVDLDRVVGAMAAGELPYADFAAAVAVHPGFYALHPGDDWASALVTVFFGRAARADEIAGLRGLTRIWQPRFYMEGGHWWNAYRAARDSGFTEPAAITSANEQAQNDARPEYGVNPCLCVAGEGVSPCTSDTFVRRIAVTGRCVAASDSFAAANVLRTVAYSPGQRDDCAGSGPRAECADREIDFVGGIAPIAPRAPIDAATAADLAGIGAAMASRNAFWDAAADRELRALLGWWQSTFKFPDSDLPDVRSVVAERLRAGDSPRAVRRLIVTSLLYRLPTGAPPVDDPDRLPPWATGPTKLLAAEGWLRAAAVAVGETSSPCDHRFVQRGGIDLTILDRRHFTYQPSSLDELMGDEGFSVRAAITLGGCNADDLRPTRSNIGLAFAQADLARLLCAYGTAVLPPGWDGDLANAVDHLGTRVLSRTVGGTERGELVAEMQACLAAHAGQPACADLETAVRWMCRRMLDSAEFATY